MHIMDCGNQGYRVNRQKSIGFDLKKKLNGKQKQWVHGHILNYFG